jgi:hypothetical protein
MFDNIIGVWVGAMRRLCIPLPPEKIENTAK